MIRNYFKTALRNLRRNKVYSFINIAGLSLGLASAMLIILYVKDEVSYDRFHKNANQVFLLGRKVVNPDGSVVGNDGYTGYFQGPQFTAAIPEIESFVRMQSGQIDIKKGEDIQSQAVFYVDSNFLSVFTFPLLSGDPKTALLDPDAIVISEEMAIKQFGRTNVLGKYIQVKEGTQLVSHLISGISKKCPQNSSIKFQALLPMKIAASDQQNTEGWLNYFLNTFVVLHKGADPKKVDDKIQKAYAVQAGEAIKIAVEKYDTKWATLWALQSLADIHLSQDYLPYELSDASNPMFSYILSGIAAFILLLACINFINLTIARSVKRAKEIGIRKVIGGNRKQLIIQFMGESFILCFTAFITAIFIVQLVLPVFNQFANKELALSYLFDKKLVAGFILLFIITGLLSGFYPAMVLSGYNPVQTLYSRFMLAGKNYLQKTLVVVQFALASFLVIATLTIFSQFNFLINKKLGYDDSNLLLIKQQGIKPADAILFSEELMKNTGISGIAPKNQDWSNRTAKINGDQKIGFDFEVTDETYLPLINVPMAEGRNFSKSFPADADQSVLVNETFVKEAGWKNPVGQQVNFWTDSAKYTVVGVVKDYHFLPLSRAIKPQLFMMKTGKRGYGSMYVKIKPGMATASLKAIEKIFKGIFPLSPFAYVFKDQENARYYAEEARWKQIMLFASLLTIFISCIGLFGLSVLSAEKRTKEIGIRKVLGASVSSIVTVLSKDFLKLVVIALAISIPLAWIAADKWLQGYPYRIALNWAMFAMAAALVVLIALATVSFQAIKAAVANPVKSLRTE